jgi:hypothetical protein
MHPIDPICFLLGTIEIVGFSRFVLFPMCFLDMFIITPHFVMYVLPNEEHVMENTPVVVDYICNNNPMVGTINIFS